MARSLPYLIIIVIRLSLICIIPTAVGIIVFLFFAELNPFHYYGEELFSGVIVYWAISLIFFVVSAVLTAKTIRDLL